MDFNAITISGRLFDMGYNPTKDENSGVAEGKLAVVIGNRGDEELIDEFNVRAYGKKSKFISGIRNGTLVMISGRMREDIRVNRDNPDTVRSKIYIDIDVLKIMEVSNDKS